MEPKSPKVLLQYFLFWPQILKSEQIDESAIDMQRTMPLFIF